MLVCAERGIGLGHGAFCAETERGICLGHGAFSAERAGICLCHGAERGISLGHGAFKVAVASSRRIQRGHCQRL